MDALQLLLSLLVLMSAYEWRSVSDTSNSTCLELNLERFTILERESFYFVPYDWEDSHFPDENVTWYKYWPRIENITRDEKQRIHHHGGALFFLNVSTSDSGRYKARLTSPLGECVNRYVKIFVINGTSRENLTYPHIKNSNQNIMIPCPDSVSHTCSKFNGSITWYKGTNLLKGEHQASLSVDNTTKEHEDIYTCICTWTHHHAVYNSSGSRRLIVKERGIHRKVEILSPTNKEQLTDKGVSIKLNCTIFCGTNVKSNCVTRWLIDGKTIETMNGYKLTSKTEIQQPSQNTISTTILTIKEVSAEHFKMEFQCFGFGFNTYKATTLSLKQRESSIPLVVGGLCVFFICVFAAVLVKCFVIDLVLLFRPYIPPGRHDKDACLYDAYVIYQMQNLDKETVDKLSDFLTVMLPSVLEEQCGYRLFIQGRDDIPGEDHLELVENRMNQSKRLMVILTPSSGCEITDGCPPSNQNSVIGGVDWQVGLHHALVQREMSVILVQLGDTGPQGYTHLSPGLQHLIRKSAPIRWPEGLQGASTKNSFFWKRVRYLMPATPARKCALSAFI